MDLRQLRYFVHVAKLKNFSRAAAHLHVAQSALSRHVSLLESELGVRLLDRHSRGAEPTAAGKVLLKRAGRLLRLVDETRQEVFSVGQSPVGHVSLAIPPSVSHLFAGPLIKACGRALPNVTLTLSEGWTGDILEWLLIGHTDLGIIYSSQVDDRIQFKPVLSDDLSLIVSAKNSALSARRSCTLQEIASMPLVVPPHPHGLRIVIEAAFAAQDLTPNITIESQVWSVIKEQLRSGHGAAIIASSEVATSIRRGHLASIPIVDPALQRTLGVAVVRDREPSQPVKAVFELIGKEGPNLSLVH